MAGGRRQALAVLLTALLLGAFPAAAYETGRLVIDTAGGPVPFTVELAAAPAERAQGLMFRDRLDPDRGMLFDFDPPAPVAMWMKNTRIALDMLFIDEAGAVVRIAAMTVPFSLATIEAGQPVRAVLEIAGGRAAAAGIAVGDRVRHPIFDPPRP